MSTRTWLMNRLNNREYIGISSRRMGSPAAFGNVFATKDS